jgi:hypothetical protein
MTGLKAVGDMMGAAARGDARPPVGGPEREGLIAARGPIAWSWQPDCWDTQIRDGEHYHERWDYIRQNPVRKGLVRTGEDWPWQGALNVLDW